MNLPLERRSEASRKIRYILVRHLIDTGRLNIMLAAGSLSLRGTFVRHSGVPSPLTAEMVGAIMSEIAGVNGVRSVSAEFDNWVQAGPGSWRPAAKKSAPDQEVRSETVPPPEDIDS